MVDRDRVDQLLALLTRYVRILRELARTPGDEFKTVPATTAAPSGSCSWPSRRHLPFGHHIVAAQGFTQPQTYAEVFAVLGREGVIETGFAETLEPMARMRNRLVLVYEDVDPALVHELINTRLGDFDRFARAITVYLDALESERQND